MSPNAYESEYPHLQRIMEIDREISLMGRFNFLNSYYWRLMGEREQLRELGINLGISLAMRDLANAGIVINLTKSSESEIKRR